MIDKQHPPPPLSHRQWFSAQNLFVPHHCCLIWFLPVFLILHSKELHPGLARGEAQGASCSSPGKALEAQAQQHHQDTAKSILSQEHREPRSWRGRRVLAPAQPVPSATALHPVLSLPSIASQARKRPKQQRQSWNLRVQHLGSTGEGDPAKNYFNLQYFWQQSFSRVAPTVFLGYVTLTQVGPDQNDPRARREKGLFSILMDFQ